MTLDRLKELISGLSTDTDTPDRIDAYNEILTGYSVEDESKYADYENQIKDLNDKYSALEERYRSTFRTMLEREEVKEETKEETVIEPSEEVVETKFEDIFIKEEI